MWILEHYSGKKTIRSVVDSNTRDLFAKYPQVSIVVRDFHGYGNDYGISAGDFKIKKIPMTHTMEIVGYYNHMINDNVEVIEDMTRAINNQKFKDEFEAEL